MKKNPNHCIDVTYFHMASHSMEWSNVLKIYTDGNIHVKDFI